VSGGPDSMALLHALVEFQAEALVVGHVNHALRGTESDADAAFVRGVCESLSARRQSPVLLRSARIDTAAIRRNEGANLEDTARRVRYDWLRKVAEETCCAYVATGHTASDQAETVLHRLLRGTGVKGLRGIAPRRSLGPGLELIRPLIQVRREDVIHYLASRGIAYREDSSNRNLDFTRNRIRHELLPYLSENGAPKIVELLNQLATQAGALYETIESRARSALAGVELPRAGPLVVLSDEPLKAVPRPLLREMCRLIWARENWSMGAMAFRDWDRLADFLAGHATALDLPEGIRARRRARVVLIGPVS
jgi:tRNA(Ile)-lysidine synthase